MTCNDNKLLVFNGHGGNNFKTILREIGLNYPNMFLCSSDWFKSLDKSNYFKINSFNIKRVADRQYSTTFSRCGN